MFWNASTNCFAATYMEMHSAQPQPPMNGHAPPGVVTLDTSLSFHLSTNLEVIWQHWRYSHYGSNMIWWWLLKLQYMTNLICVISVTNKGKLLLSRLNLHNSTNGALRGDLRRKISNDFVLLMTHCWMVWVSSAQIDNDSEKF